MAERNKARLGAYRDWLGVNWDDLRAEKDGVGKYGVVRSDPGVERRGTRLGFMDRTE